MRAKAIGNAWIAYRRSVEYLSARCVVRNWSGWTIEDFMAEIDTYIRWYNERRIKLTLGGMSPVEYRESLG